MNSQVLDRPREAGGRPHEPCSPPLCVDLDGTLVKSDTFHECLILLLKQNPLCLFLLPWWLLRGRAHLKYEVCRRVELPVAGLPYDAALMSHLVDCRKNGRELVLVTGADRAVARQVADHLDLFSDVIASDGRTNMTGSRKRDELTRRFGRRGFDYAGNGRADLPVWAGARQAIVVNAGTRTAVRARVAGNVAHEFGDRHRTIRSCLRAIRVHQWVKNVLVFVPLITSHQLANAGALLLAAGAFFAFSFCASSVYVLNDLLDLHSDRRNEKKRLRPFAAGHLSALAGIGLLTACLSAAVGLSTLLPPRFGLALAVYYVITVAYSARLKRMLLVDVFVLGGLYTLRVLAGGAVTGIPCSPWLLAFAMFFFVSLAFAKRYAELGRVGEKEIRAGTGRGYITADRNMIGQLGIASGFACVVILSLYINSPQVEPLYQSPILLWLLCPLVMYWISRVWIIAARERMNCDPVVFALKDRVSYLVAGAGAVVMMCATFGGF